MNVADDPKLAATAIPGGNDPDLLAPWAGRRLVAGGPCGYYRGQGDHLDFGERWTDDHEAVDFGVCGAGDVNVPVVAAHDGVVRIAERDPNYGWTVVIERSPGQLATRYAHLRDRPAVRVGQTVVAGARIGAVGYSGLGGQGAAQAHLHFVVYSGRGRKAGRRIVFLARQRVCNDCSIEPRTFRPGEELKPVDHYACEPGGSPEGRQLQRGQRQSFAFKAAGSQVTGGSLWLTAFPGDPHRATLGVYSQPDLDPASRVGTEVSIEAAVPQTMGVRADVSFMFNPPLAVIPGKPLWFLISAAEDSAVTYHVAGFDSASGSPEGCGVVGRLVGTE